MGATRMCGPDFGGGGKLQRLRRLRYYKGTLMDHLLNIQEQAEDFIEIQEPKMMEAWGLTNQLKSEDFLKYAGLKKNLEMTLTRMTLEQIIWV